MKKTIALFAILLISVFSFAQNPKLNYQAVVRDSQNKLVVEQPVTVTVNVLKADNTSQFEQTLNANTNRNGLMSLEIGDETAAWSNIDWVGAKIRTSVAFDGTVLVDTTIVNAVPFALYANSVSDEVVDNLMEAQASQMDALQQNLDSLSNLFFDHAYLDGKPCPLTSTISDGTNSYPTVVIGKQCWMAQNLRTSAGLNYREDYFNANNNANNDEEYGLLYTWYAATYNQTQDEEHPMVKGICPEGWHIPSIDEWNTMTSYINSRPTQFKHCGNGNIASTLTSKTRWSGSSDIDCSPAKDLSANNITGFNILPAGEYFNGPFGYGTSSYFWSSSELAYNYAYHVRFFNNSATVINDNFDMNGAFSVRCLRNTAVASPSESASPTIGCDDVKACIADELNKYTTTDQLCNVIVNNCTQLATDNDLQNAVDTLVGISTLTALINELQTLTDQVGTMSEKINTLEKTIDSLTTFHCGIDKVKDHQDNEYKTTKIGNQCWMAQNLRCTTSPSRNNLVLATGNESSTSTSYYYKIESFGNEGYLYNWRAALDTNVDVSTINTLVVNRRGLCPEGWHLPTMDELNTLFSNGNAGQFAAPNGSYTGSDWSGSTNCTDGYPKCTDYLSRNSTGFSAVPVGYINGSHRWAGDYAQFWSSTTSNTYANVKFLHTDMGSAANGSASKSGGNSIRCVRDVESVYISGSTPSVNISVTTDSAKVNGNNLELYGNVTNLGGNASVNAGFEYRRGVGGTIYSTTLSDVTTTGSFSKTLNGTNFILYRAFVSDGSNKVYGSWKSYTPTLPHIVDPIE